MLVDDLGAGAQLRLLRITFTKKVSCHLQVTSLCLVLMVWFVSVQMIVNVLRRYGEVSIDTLYCATNLWNL